VQRSPRVIPNTVASVQVTGLAGAGAIDLAGCLRASGASSCFSGASARTRVDTAGATAPGAPGTLTASVNGSTVTLTWSAPGSGDPVTSYVLEAGSATGLANLANASTGSTATTYVAPGVGVGTYFVRVRAQNAAGVSAVSNEVVVTVGQSACTSAPNAPTGLTAAASGSTVTITWSAPGGGCAPTSYILQAGSAAGLSNLAVTNTGSVATTLVVTNVGAGTYFIRVLATNASGQSAPSNEVRLVVSAVTAADAISNFGANDTYLPSATFFGGYPPNFPFTSHNLAISFTPAATTKLNTIELALSQSPGSRNPIQVTLMSDAGGVPSGLPTETFNVSGVLTAPPSIVTLTSTQRPTLEGGKVYWVTVAVPNAVQSDFANWFLSSVSTPYTTARQDVPGPWAAEANDPRPQVFRVKFIR
jgi:hypothetical protein